MENLMKIVESSGLPYISWVVGIVPIVYFLVHKIYDIFTKSDIERILTYRGKDRVSLFFMFYVYTIILVTISAFEQIVEIWQENNIWIAIVIDLLVSFIFLMTILSVFAIGHLILILSRLYPVYEVKLDEEYWRIFKVTKDNRVILRKNSMYKVMPDVNELNNQLIRQRKRIKKNKEKS
ncbi:hypothetical protein J416_09549 [Gracilibacillus halophilus YIM-C55.5]|uniref:Uncharacterized protein n=1 Tax=Gracilibacillus halophilus YIM-C55.5 TaxID=1308866 RepID=N4WKN9_9BACI|nr:hypothetical protein [Gracilibacillus halophilus]ENH96732.1 hypothetical protein J416_09549 [Gracilibacillus halophilus YIM-C55.5]